MSRYRKIPIEIEAIQFKRNNLKSIKAFAGDNISNLIIIIGERYHCYIRTLEGIMEASEGDYIIKGINGEIYSCKPDIFEKTYEEVEEEEQK